MIQTDIMKELITLRNDLLSSKNLIDQSPEVKTSRRLQGAIARCSVLLTRLSQQGQQGQQGQTNVAQTVNNEDVSNG